MRKKLFAALISILLCVPGVATAVQVTLPGSFTGFDYNTIDGSGNGYDGQPGAIGCGPTTGTAVLNYFTVNNGATGLITDPLTDARTLWSYTNTGADGFGAPWDFQFGVEQFALDRGYIVDAVVHKEATSYTGISSEDVHYPSRPPGGTDDLAIDATFWDTTIWDVNDDQFIDFVAAYIDAGTPMSVAVNSDGIGSGSDHWMALVGYDKATLQWAGYNTWDTSLHWYDVTSAYIEGNPFGISVVRTFEFIGPVDGGGGTTVPEPSTLLLLGAGLFGMTLVRRRKA